MDLYEVIDQVVALLHKRGRVAYRAIQYQFQLDDEGLDALTAELIDAQRVTVDEGGTVLVWTGGATQSPIPQTPNARLQTPDPRPLSYTPPRLAERILAEREALEARGAPEGERKTITALFADLKGSTALIEGLDPEEARAIIDPALQLMMDAVHRYEGYVAQALGDGIFALFGAPIAHEDHPQQALYAALRMQEEMRRYSDHLRLKGGAPLYLRVGVNTGEVVVRSIRKDDLHTDYVPVGHSTNLAARMEQMATPGSILVTEYTYKLTDGYFAFKGLGAAQIKGVEAPLNVYEVLDAGPLRTRLQVAARRGLTRFIGRQSEMDQLQRAFAHAKAGHGQIVGVMGEPGLGKSRLFREFVGAVREPPLRSQSGCLGLEAFSVSHGKASPYLPLIELLKNYFRMQPQDDDRTRREKVGGKVLMLDRSLEDTLPYLFVLLGIDDPLSTLQQMDAQVRRRRTFEALKRLFLRESLNQPLLLIFEDLHWIDTETQGFLDTLSESVASAKLLLLTNYRPEYRHEWGQKTYYTQLRLAPLGKEEAEEFLDGLLGSSVGARHASPLRTLTQLILEKTDCNPFFMEEVVQELFEQGILVRDAVGAHSGAPLPTDLHSPTTVQGVLAARIDRLTPDEKELLQQLAVIGREFPLSLVRQGVPQSEAELYWLLSSLQSKEFLYEQPAFPEVEYTFKHALTQEVAYGSVLLERRRMLHERTAQAIEALFHSQLEDHYNALAQHYTRSGNTQKAVEYLHRAGQQAVQRSANEEAVRQLNTALELLRMLPATPERTQQELLLHVTLGPALLPIRGWAASEVQRVYSRARELCQQSGESPHLFPILCGLSFFYAVRAEVQTAYELGEQLLRLAQRTHEPSLLVVAHWVRGWTLFHRGEFAPSCAHLEQGHALYRPEYHQSQTGLCGFDAGVYCLSWEAWNRAYLGYPDQARGKMQEALTLAQELTHPFSLTWALLAAAWLYHLLREGRAIQEQVEAVLALSHEHGFAHERAIGTIWRGWALADQDQIEEGIVQIRRGLIAHRAVGGELARPYFLALLAETYGKAGQVKEGLNVLTEALAGVNETGERFYEAEMYRLKGQLTLQQFQVSSSKFQVENSLRSSVQSLESEAEECFLKAIEIARRQSAKSLELRAVMSLSRLWNQQGKQAEARQMLAEIYGWFTEGFDTKDLQEAKALLAELS